MTNHIDRETLHRLLSGERDPALPKWAEHIKNCPECREEMDIALLSDEWLMKDAARMAPDKKPLFSGPEWNAMFEKAWDKAAITPAKANNTLRLPRYLYALAAGIILFIGGYLTLKPVGTMDLKPVVAIVPAEKPAKRNEPVRQIEIRGNTKAFVSQESDIRLTQNAPKEAATEMTKGAALFTVEPGKYKRFMVSTPDAEIVVTGTIFDVWISENKTRVSVLRGSVSVFYKKLKTKISLSKEETSFPDSGRVDIRPLSPEEKKEISASLEKTAFSLLEEKQKPLARIAEAVPVVPLSVVLEQKLSLGLRSLNEKDFPAALSYFNEIKGSGLKNSTVQTASFEAALLLMNNLGRTDDGAKALEEYLQVFDKGLYTEEALVELVSAYRKQGNTDKIILYENKYVAIFPEKAYTRDFIYESATLLREARKDYPNAVRAYSLFIEKNARDFRAEDAYFWMGKCLLEMGDKPKARETYNRYLKNYPEGRWVNDIKSLLQQ